MRVRDRVRPGVRVRVVGVHENDDDKVRFIIVATARYLISRIEASGPNRN